MVQVVELAMGGEETVIKAAQVELARAERMEVLVPRCSSISVVSTDRDLSDSSLPANPADEGDGVEQEEMVETVVKAATHAVRQLTVNAEEETAATAEVAAMEVPEVLGATGGAAESSQLLGQHNR